MQRLTAALHPLLNENVIKLLDKHNILTIGDFLHEDANQLMRITNIDLGGVLNIKNDMLRLLGVAPTDGLTYHNQLNNEVKYVATGIQSLDELLNGGLQTGNLVDVCGLAEAGKTQLYTTIAINLATTYNETFVIDTKGDFSGERIHQILISRRVYSERQRNQILRSIRVEKCNDPTALIKLIETLIEKANTFTRLKMLVIDSLPMLWFLYQNDWLVGQQQLSILSNLLRKLAVEHNIVVLTVNIVFRWNSVNVSEDRDIVEDLDQSQNEYDSFSPSPSPPKAQPLLNPALGKYWNSICPLRLLISRHGDSTTTTQTNSNNKSQRVIRILKSNQLKSETCCTVEITDGGII